MTRPSDAASLREAAQELDEAQADFIEDGGAVALERLDRARIRLHAALAAPVASADEHTFCPVCYGLGFDAVRSSAPAEWEETDGMCPNCITPWKCNGPHLADETVAGRRNAAAIRGEGLDVERLAHDAVCLCPNDGTDPDCNYRPVDARVIEAFDLLGGMWSWSEENGYFEAGHGYVLQAGRLLREVVGRPAQMPARIASEGADRG